VNQFWVKNQFRMRKSETHIIFYVGSVKNRYGLGMDGKIEFREGNIERELILDLEVPDLFFWV